MSAPRDDERENAAQRLSEPAGSPPQTQRGDNETRENAAQRLSRALTLVPGTGRAGERWLVRLLVDRDPDLEAPPTEWDWQVMLGGGDPVVVSAGIVGSIVLPPFDVEQEVEQ